VRGQKEEGTVSRMGAVGKGFGREGSGRERTTD